MGSGEDVSYICSECMGICDPDCDCPPEDDPETAPVDPQ